MVLVLERETNVEAEPHNGLIWEFHEGTGMERVLPPGTDEWRQVVLLKQISPPILLSHVEHIPVSENIKHWQTDCELIYASPF